MTLCRRLKFRRLRAVLLLGMAMVSGGAAFATAPASRPTTPSVRDLILQVDSDSSAERRAATLQLNSLPGDALPAVEEAVATSAVGAEGMLRLRAALKYLRPRARRQAQLDARDAWELKQLREDYTRAGVRGAWDEQALAAIEAYFKWRAASVRLGTDAAAPARAASTESFARAVKAGCMDPLVLSLYHMSVGGKFGLDEGPVPEPFRETTLKVKKGAYGAFAKLMILTERVGLLRSMSSDQVRDATALLTTLSKLEGLPETELDVCENRFYDAALRANRGLLMVEPNFGDACAKLSPGKAGPLYIKARILVDMGARYLGNAHGRADVPALNWKAFCDNLSRAGVELEKAWKIDPSDSRIASLMIVVQLGTGSREEMEKWFARAAEADPDNVDACLRKLNFLSPAWYGSRQEMIQFGRDCLHTENWRGGIPMLLIRAHRAADDESGDVKSYYARPEVWEDLSAVYEGHLLNYPADVKRRSEFVMLAARADKWDVVREQFEILGDRGDPATFGGKATMEYYRDKGIRRGHAPANRSTTRPASAGTPAH